MKKHTAEENQEKKVTLLQKVSYLFDRKQKRQIAGLALLILIGGLDRKITRLNSSHT